MLINVFYRLRYRLQAKKGIVGKSTVSSDCEYLYTDTFSQMHNWGVTSPETTLRLRNDGIRLLFRQVDSKGFYSPCIISRTAFYGGAVEITTTLNPYEKILHYFILRSNKNKDELGFKIANGNAYLIAPHMKMYKFKLYNFEREHTFQIEVDPDGDMVYWRIDGRTVRMHQYPSLEHKHLMIGMNASESKLKSKDLPLSFVVKNVKFWVNHKHEMHRTK